MVRASSLSVVFILLSLSATAPLHVLAWHVHHDFLVALHCHMSNLCYSHISIALLTGARSNILELVALTHAQFLIIFRELLNPSRKPSSSYQQTASEYVTLLEAPHVICPLLVPPSCRTTAEPLALTFQSAYDADHVSPCIFSH